MGRRRSENSISPYSDVSLGFIEDLIKFLEELN